MGNFDTMRKPKVNHIKSDRGRWFYRRRVPQRHQKTLGLKIWNRPCGDVTYQKAVALVTTWAEEHDTLIAQLDIPTTANLVRQDTEIWAMAPAVKGIIHAIEFGDVPIDPLEAAKAGLKAAEENPDFDYQDRLIRYRAIIAASFGDHVVVPTDPDERDEFDMVKRKLERRIADLAGDPNTITAVAERYYKFAQVKPGVKSKYRRNISKLVRHLGDVPLPHITSSQLRSFRDEQAETMIASSLQSVFTPIKGMFGYAVNNEIIMVDPMGSVPLQTDKRSIQARKWKPFTPEETQHIFEAMDRVWCSSLRGMSDERRVAIHMAVRVMAFTAMRPKEVLHLESGDVTDEWIKVKDSKTSDSDRTIPLHPELADFPEFFHSGGFDTFLSQRKDRVQTVRHNFLRLTRDMMDPSITDSKKVLYSFRSTFSNAMRRAGADAEMRRAILGHSEAGALKHYDDGPEFAKKRKWVRASDPRTVYIDSGDHDDLV